MARSRKAVGCPAEAALQILQGRWKLMILHRLVSGVNRFGALKRALEGISEKILTQQLRALERDGIVQRTVYAQVPPKVEYALTDSGKALKPIVEAMHEWGSRFDRGPI